MSSLARRSCFVLMLLALGVQAERISIPDAVTVRASAVEEPPAWALKQRELIHYMEAAASYYLDRFTRSDGSLYGSGPFDDVYEMFFNWPLFYAIGAEDALMASAQKEYEAITHQWLEARRPLYEEFPTGTDWFHTSEGMMAFYDLAVGDPTIPANIERARRFAGLYMGEDPAADNYDPQYRVIRGVATGSTGPSDDHYDAAYNLKYGHASLYPIVEEMPTNWSSGSTYGKQLIGLYNSIVLPCDVPVNLAVTALVANAYLYTGEEKYKRWVLDYADAWMDRIEANDGILPDNVGRNGEIGEYRRGQWWGGLYGWMGTYSNHMIFQALTVAAESAHLLSGDPKYLDLLRSQLKVLLDQSITTPEGQLLVPYQYNVRGWQSFRPMRVFDPAHLWHASMSEQDWQIIERLRDGNRYYPLGYSGDWGVDLPADLETGYNRGPAFDWNHVPSEGDRNIDFPTEYARLTYYAGDNPDWPLAILDADLRKSQDRVAFMERDTRSINDIDGDDLYPNNPVITKGLTQVTMGAPQTVYNGGLLRARVRYYDLDRGRPGLPPDVAALVEKLHADSTVVRLINLNETAAREVLVQAGAFSEHEFTVVRYMDAAQPVARDVVAPYFAVVMPPSTSIRLNIGNRCFVNAPTYAFPWHDRRPVTAVPSEEWTFETNSPALRLLGNHPNPFNPSTVVRYELSRPAEVSATVYNALGQQVSALDLGRQSAGVHRFGFTVTGFATGLYLCRVEAGGAVVVGKMLYME